MYFDRKDNGKPCLVICAGTGGQASGSNDIIRIIKREILDRELHDRISLRITGCLGFCQMDPFILVEPGHNLYPKLKKEHVSKIIDAVLKDEVVEELLYREPNSPKEFFSQNDIPFFKGQTRTILGQNQNLDPIRILDYIRIGGYAALEKVMGNPDPGFIISEVLKSGLRGRGGAGFSTGKKWEFASKSGAASTQKYIVCNADEGDPGAYMDRSLLEGNPHAILEGMSACPLGTEAWRYVAHIAKGEYEEAYKVIREPNPLPVVCARVCHHPCEERCRLGTTGDQPIAIRALKRFITEKFDPKQFLPGKVSIPDKDAPKVAVVGAGPSGLTAAHYLSLQGCRVTIFEGEDKPGGMLQCGIPEYRMPRDVLKKQIDALLDENITLKCNTALGRDISVDSLLDDGFQAIYLSMGAHKSLRLGIDGENAEGVWSAMAFLKAYNLRQEQLAKGRVGVIGGGNSAIDAARTAIRQKNVESVTIFYRRTRREMPAYEEEIEAALEEGVVLKTLISPANVVSENSNLVGLECVRNKQADFDSSGRQRPVPVSGTEHTIDLDTLIVAIGEIPDAEGFSMTGVDATERGNLRIDAETFCTSRPGVFAGGDVVTGPNTVVDAIAAGKKASEIIYRYLHGEELVVPAVVRLPEVFIEPVEVDDEERSEAKRAEPGTLPTDARTQNFTEVEQVLSAEEAMREARRCLRCDLEFTQSEVDETGKEQAGGKSA